MQTISEAVLKDSEAMDILAECSVSTKMTAKALFPERFYASFSGLHEQIFDLIDSGAPRVAIAAPRGIGKTSIVDLALAGRRILFRDSKFIPIVSTSFDSAVLQTENLKHELTTNQVIKALFGSIKTKSAAGIDESFSKKAWVALSTLIYPRGSGQQIRGILYHNFRPDLIIIDDLEDPETIENDELRAKRKVWFHADLLKAVSRLDKNWQVVYIDTLKHEDSLLQDLLDNPDWESIRLEMFGDDCKSNAPEFMSDKEVLKEVEYHRRSGLLDVLYREFRNLPISTEDATFRQEYFQPYDEAALANDKKVVLETVVIVDPAKTVKLHSAESAIVGVGIDRASARLYVRDVVSRKMYPDELYNEMFDMAARLGAFVIGVEVTSLNEFITQPIRNEMFKRGKFKELIELKPRGGEKKEKRIAQLVPFYRQGYIYHNPSCCGGLEAQLLSFPRSKLKDIMDAFAYIIQMLDLGDRYFEPPEEEFPDPEDEYKDLSYDKPLENWRTEIGLS